MMQDDLSYEKKKNEGLVFENEHAFCIVCVEPLNRGHVMIIPKRFVRELDELHTEEAGAFLSVLGKTRNALEALFPGEIIVYQNNSKTRTQPRLHVHLLPIPVSLRHLYNAQLQNPDVPAIRERKTMDEILVLAKTIRDIVEK